MELETIVVLVTMVVTFLCGLIGYATFYMNSKKNTKQETKEEVATSTRLDTKLDMISKNIDEIRLDNKEFTKSMQQIGERLSAVESSTKSAHHRIDNLEEIVRK